MSRRVRLLALAVLIGALLAAFCDDMHAYTDTLRYPSPMIHGARWSFPAFTLAFSAMSALYIGVKPSFVRRFGGTRVEPTVNAREVVSSTLLFAFVYLTSAFGNRHPVLLSITFYAAFLVRWLVDPERAWMLFLALSLAVGGTLTESAMSAAGLVTYTHQDVALVPLWLGGLYMHGAFAVRDGLRFTWFAARSSTSAEPASR